MQRRCRFSFGRLCARHCRRLDSRGHLQSSEAFRKVLEWGGEEITDFLARYGESEERWISGLALLLLSLFLYTCRAILAHCLSFGLGGLRSVWPLGGL